MPIYEKSVRELMRDMVAALGMQADGYFTKQQATEWFKTNYPKIKRGTIAAHLVCLSTNSPSRTHHTIRPGRDDLLFRLEDGRFRLYDPASDPPPIHAIQREAPSDDETIHAGPPASLPVIPGPLTVGNIGLYYICYRLSRLGWNVMPTARNAKGVDILCYNQDATKTHTIQVKTLSRAYPVPLGKSLDHFFADFVVVCGHVIRETPECFILVPDEVRRLADRSEKDGKVSYWLPPKAYDADTFREQWTRIGSGLPGLATEEE